MFPSVHRFRPLPELLALLCCLLAAGAATAQGRSPLRLDSVMVAGARASVTEAWGTFDFIVSNPSDQDRLARVRIVYEGYPDVQYGRDVWVPARSTITSWLLAGPAP